MKPFTLILCFTTVAILGLADDRDTVQPGRTMSEHQVADLASRQLPQAAELRCEFQAGVWNIVEVQKDVWGVSSLTTNATGRITVTSTNATRLVLRVRDADGKIEPVTPP